MAMVINSNIMSLNAQNQLTKTNNDLNTAMERLTSGKRINSAADDAAGLAISSRMTSQVRGLDQAVRNANDGISLIQTAEGALEESTNILQRMRELSIQSANGTYNDGNRATLDAEFKQLTEELDRISETTTFNGQKILDGGVGEVDLQVGANANETISFGIQAMDAKTLGMGSTSVDVLGAEVDIAATSFAASLGADIKDGDVLINGQSIGTFDTGASGDANTLSDLVQSINENVNGVTASAITQLEGSGVGNGVINADAGEGFSITMADVNGGTQTYQIQEVTTESMDDVIAAIDDVTGGKVSASVNDKGELVLANDTGSNITVAALGGLDLDKSLGLAAADLTADAQLVLTSDNGDPISIERGATGTLADLERLGFRESNLAGQIEGAALVGSDASASWNPGDLSINGVQIDNKDTDSLQGKVDAINAASDETGVTATAFGTVRIDMSDVNIGSAFGGSAMTLQVNGASLDFGGVTDLQGVADTFNDNADTTGVLATVSGNNVILESDQGAINFGTGTAATVSGALNGTAGGSAAGFVGATFVEFMASGETSNAITSGAAAFTAEAGLKLTSDNGNPISVEIGDDAVTETLGLLEANATAEGSFGTSISQISIGTAANAQKAIGVIDNALDTVNDVRSELGAVNNRLDFTINNLSSVSENMSAARSRIEDADFAAESAALSRSQVLQQAGTSMLAQANAAPQQVLSLLQ